MLDSMTSSTKGSDTGKSEDTLCLNSPKMGDLCILTHLFGSRVQEWTFPEKQVIKPRATRDGCELQLISLKLVQGEKNWWGQASRSMKCVYWTVSGPGMHRLLPQHALEQLGGFGLLSSREAMVRLQVLQSPVKSSFPFPKAHKLGVQLQDGTKRAPVFDHLDPGSFCLLPTEGNDGCGYICHSLLSTLYGNTVKAKRIGSIQIRCVVPELGIFKGVLVSSPIPAGKPPIQFTPSMRKVGPVASSSRTTRAKAAMNVLLVNKHHPTDTVWMVGRAVNPAGKAPPPSAKIKPLLKPGQTVKHGMITRLWRSQGVPWEVCETYTTKSASSWEHLRHCWLQGVTDPTHCIPYDKVFLSGFPHKLPHVFCTRSPCIQSKSGKLLQLLTSKPKTMPSADWDFLQGLEFGFLVFPDAPQDKPFVPSTISNGDLDGDLYFACWDAEILRHLSAFHAEQRAVSAPAAAEPAVHRQVLRGSNNTAWLEDAQAMMCDTVGASELSMLVGKLYKLSEKYANASPGFMDDPSAIACATAYEDALLYEKHGTPVRLPEHLHTELPEKLRKYLTCSESV